MGHVARHVSFNFSYMPVEAWIYETGLWVVACLYLDVSRRARLTRSIPKDVLKQSRVSSLCCWRMLNAGSQSLRGTFSDLPPNDRRQSGRHWFLAFALLERLFEFPKIPGHKLRTSMRVAVQGASQSYVHLQTLASMAETWNMTKKRSANATMRPL